MESHPTDGTDVVRQDQAASNATAITKSTVSNGYDVVDLIVVFNNFGKNDISLWTRIISPAATCWMHQCHFMGIGIRNLVVECLSRLTNCREVKVGLCKGTEMDGN